MEIPSQKPSYYGKFRGQAMVTLSFDDGREDFHRVAYPIMKKYGLLGTFHIVTGWVEGRWSPPNTEGWASAYIGGSMTLEQIQECHRYGIEMSAHGDLHDNTEQNIYDCVDKLKDWGVTKDGIVHGFASPGSGLTPENRETMKPWFINAGLTHARSGSAPGVVGRGYNNNMSYPPPYDYRLTSQAVTDNTSVSELIGLISDAISKKEWCIIMLHSVLKPTDPNHGATDNWWWDESNFEQLCSWLASIPEKDLLTVTMRDGFHYAKGNHPDIAIDYFSKIKGNRYRKSNFNTDANITNLMTSTKLDHNL
jgi:peptidoglycan/xylan/chitin deacetylase (PgdA/CDA1 family)